MPDRFTAEEKHREALREVAMRKNLYGGHTPVYGRRTPAVTISPSQQRRIDLMQEIADDYAALAKKDRLL